MYPVMMRERGCLNRESKSILRLQLEVKTLATEETALRIKVTKIKAGRSLK